MRDNWKVWVAILCLLGVLAFAVQRFHRSFEDQAPVWLKLEEKNSPALPKGATEQFAAFRKEAEAEARRSALPFGSVQLIEIVPGQKYVRTWHVETFTNPGPGVLSDFEINRWMADDRPVGWYTLEGEPLHFMLKHHPKRPKVAFPVIQMDKPVPATQSIQVVCVERVPFTPSPDATGSIWYRFAKFRGPVKAIHAVGLCVPQNYLLTRYDPSDSAYVTVKGIPMVGWLNSRVDAAGPAPSVAFKAQ